MRFGISTMDGILPKSLRTRRPHSMLRAIHPPRPVQRGWARPTAVTHSGESGAAPGGGTFRGRGGGGPPAPRHPGRPGPRPAATRLVSGEPRGPPICVTPMAEGLFDFHRGSDLLELLLHVRRLRPGPPLPDP